MSTLYTEPEEEKVMLTEGVNAMMEIIALKLLNKKSKNDGMLRIKDTNEDRQDEERTN